MDKRPLYVSIGVWLGAVASAALWLPAMLPIALICFLQNVSFTFVSRGRNSGSLIYHLVAAAFSNGFYALVLFLSIDVLTAASTDPAGFVSVYAAACLSGSVAAHWLALRLERGKARNVQEDRLKKLERRIEWLENGE